MDKYNNFNNLRVDTPMINRAFSSCQDMAALCKPLNAIGINYLSYTRVYKNGARINFVSDPKSIEFNLIQKKCVNSGNEMHPDNYRSGQIIVWASLPKQDYYHEAKLQFDIGHGIYLFGDTNDDYCESYGFATTTHN